MSKVTNTSLFVEKAKIIHKDFYDYSLTEFAGSVQKVKIICPKHGVFEQTPNNHLTGYGCSKCGAESTVSKQMVGKDNWVTRAVNIHNDTYDYSMLPEDMTGRTSVPIVCPTHGVFYQSMNNHTHKTKPQGCPCCGRQRVGKSRQLSHEEFVQKAEATHGKKYLYNNKYDHYHSKITITCPDHGDFQQTPAHHIGGTGCPSCTSYGFSLDKPAILYYLKINDSLYKIGITNRTVEERFYIADLEKIEVVFTCAVDKGATAADIERAIKAKFKEFKYKGSPVLTSGNTELFTKNILEGASTLEEITTIINSIE